MDDVFISYSRRDKVFTQKLYESLIGANRTVWADWEDIPASSDWFAEIKQGIEETDSVLFVLSPEWIKSNECRKEMDYAVKMGKRLFPILYIPVDPKDVPPELAKINWVYLREDDDFDKGFQTLCSAMDTDLDWIKTHTRIQVRALEWEKKKRDHSFVLRGNDLTEGEQFIAGAANKSPVPTALQSEYILASRTDATRRQRQTLAGVVAALVISIALGIIAFFQRQEAVKQATIAQSQVLAVNIKLDPTKPSHNLLLGIESYRMVKDLSQPDKVIAEQALRDTLSQVSGIPLSVQVSILAFSPDGRWLATGSDDTVVRLWHMGDLAKGPIVLGKQQGEIIALTFSPDGYWLAAGSETGIRLWEMQNPTTEPIVLSRQTGANHTLAFSPDSRWLATGSEDNAVHLWDMQNLTANPIALSGHKGPIYTLAFSPDSRWLATGSEDKSTLLWDMQNPTAKPTIVQRGEYPLNSLVFSPDGRWLATADYIIRLWDMQSLSADPVVLEGSEGTPEYLTFSPNGRWLALKSFREGPDVGRATVWDMQGDSPESATWSDVNTNDIVALAFSPDDRWLAVSSRLGRASFTTTRLLDTQYSFYDSSILRGDEGGMNALAFSPDGHWLATVDGNHLAHLWNIQNPAGGPLSLQGYKDFTMSADGHWLRTVGDSASLWEIQDSIDQPLALREHDDLISNFAMSPDGRWLATNNHEDKTAHLWDMQNPSSNPTVRNAIEADFYSALSPGGHWLVTERVIGTRQNRTTQVWNLQDTTIGPIILNKPGFSAFLFSPDIHWLAMLIVDEVSVYLLDLQKPSSQPMELPALTGGILGKLTFSPDSHWLLNISDSASQLWDMQLSSFKPIPLYANDNSLYSYAPFFSPDGRWLVKVSEDNSVRLWNMQNPSIEPILLGGNELSFNSVTQSPSGRWLVTGGDDKITRLWDMQDPTKDPVILSSLDNCASFVFSSDEFWLAANCSDFTIHLVDMRKPTAEPSTLNTSDIYLHETDIYISHIAVSPDDRWLAIADSTTGIRLVDMQNLSADPIALSDILYAEGNKMAFSPDGRWLVTAYGFNSIHLWDMNYDHLLETACKVVGRNFTRAEWDRYFPNEKYRQTCEQWPPQPEIPATPTATP